MLSTPITCYLQQRNIPFQLLMQGKGAASIQEAANLRGIKAEIMVKAIVLRDMGGQYALACCPGNESIDPKKVRHTLETRRMTCASREEVEAITGATLGTVTPLLLRTAMPILFDPRLKQHSRVTISSGNNSAGLLLSLNDLVQCCSPLWADICR
ncbi:aminoacyl-tRNA deacylase [Vibrio methylphosphonaticus]|uniref:aminoacyl-tRNA deacylase n=1 Tax=Vibrio methylphosphonaticus TaxID=2946866 RepID=UPI002029C7CD|nr:YbaK/EbsC family protein [Vibrio methylphosphonaticus]MCL9773470.1 YbaK/EbsC family protein [Vibrio methylphosphonaticus]